MGWSHIVLEAYCLFDYSEDKDKKIPSYCISCEVGRHCLNINNKNSQFCPFFGFSPARSTVVLTDIDGDDIACTGFYLEDDSIDENEWLKREKKWLRKWKKKIDDEKTR
jgi:hypothetical protein